MPRKSRLPPREQPPQDDRIMAALAHAAIVVPVWGLIASVVIWATQKEKSRFVGFQALQAIAYQCLELIASFLCMPLYMCSISGVAIVTSISTAAVERGGAMGPGETGMIVLTSILPILLFMVGFFVWVIYTCYAFYGAWSVLKGKNFRYMVLGPRLERYLSQ